MPHEAAIKQLLDDCWVYAARNFHAPPVRGGGAFAAFRPDRNLGVKKATDSVAEKLKHDKVGMIKPAFDGVGQVAGIAVAVASPAAGPAAPAVAGVGVGITITATVLDIVAGKAKLAYKSRKKNKSLEDKAYLLSEEGLSDLAHNFDKAVIALCEYWDAIAGPSPQNCVDAARLAFRYGKFEKRFLRLNSVLTAVALLEVASRIQDDCLHAFQFVMQRKHELLRVLSGHDRELAEQFARTTTTFTPTNDGYLNWADLLPPSPTEAVGIKTAIERGRYLGDKKRIYERVSKLSHTGLPTLHKRARAAARAGEAINSIMSDVIGVDGDDFTGSAVGQFQDTAMSLVEGLATAAIQGGDLASAAVDALNPLAGGPSPQMAAAVAGTVVEALAVAADDYANWKWISRPLSPLDMPDVCTRVDLLDYRERVWRARKLLESRIEPLVNDLGWLEKGKASVLQGLERLRVASDLSRKKTAAAAAAAAGFSAPASSVSRKLGIGQRTDTALAASSESPTVETIASLYYLQAKAYEMLRDSALIQFMSQLVTDGLTFMQRCRMRATTWTPPKSAGSSAASGRMPGELDRRLEAFFSSTRLCPHGHTCYHPDRDTGAYRPHQPL